MVMSGCKVTIYYSTLSIWADLLDNGGCFVVVVGNGSELDWNEILLAYQCKVVSNQ